MSDTTTDEAAPYAISWGTAFLASVIITICCVAFSYAWEAIAQAMGDF